MARGHWLRFLPRAKKKPEEAGGSSNAIFQAAEAIVYRADVTNFEILDRYIASYKEQMDHAKTADWLALLILQAPRAAHAQEMMDEHPHGYHDRKARLYELIDFNDSFVSTVLSLPEGELESFSDNLRESIDRFCKKMYSRTFTDKQYEAVVHGLSREIAVYKAAVNAGLDAAMTSRTADAFGIDMQIRDQSTEKYINIDCKTSSSFHFRLKDLVHEHRMAPHDMIDAETKGWWEIVNRNDSMHIKIILLRISQDELGEIRAFQFVNEQAMVDRIKQVLKQRSLSDGQFGHIFATDV